MKTLVAIACLLLATSAGAASVEYVGLTGPLGNNQFGTFVDPGTGIEGSLADLGIRVIGENVIVERTTTGITIEVETNGGIELTAPGTEFLRLTGRFLGQTRGRYNYLDGSQLLLSVNLSETFDITGPDGFAAFSFTNDAQPYEIQFDTILTREAMSAVVPLPSAAAMVGVMAFLVIGRRAVRTR